MGNGRRIGCHEGTVIAAGAWPSLHPHGRDHRALTAAAQRPDRALAPPSHLHLLPHTLEIRP
jgi:hypothetical protein